MAYFPIEEGFGHIHGNLARDWESKTVTVKGEDKVIWSNALAHGEGDDETTWVDLTVWPNQKNFDYEGQAIASATKKGTKTIVWGKIVRDPYVHNGESRVGWKMSVYGAGAVIRMTTEQWNSMQGTADAATDLAARTAMVESAFSKKEMEDF